MDAGDSTSAPSGGGAPSPRTVRIAILDDYQQAARRFFPLSALEAVCRPELIVYTDHAADGDELVDRAGSAEVVVAMRERSPLPRAVIERLERTKLIVTTGARNAAIDTEAAAERGIVVCGTRGKDTAPAELTWGLLLALVRRIPAEDAGVREGRWGVHVGESLSGKVLGVLGFGEIGRQVAGYGNAFGMKVLAHSRSLTRELAATLGCESVGVETLLRESDVVSLHLKLTPQTRGTIGAEQLGFMKSSAYLVNTARGALIDEQALVRALQAGELRGAALDVYEQEPLPLSSPLLQLGNVVLTPHVGYVTENRYAAYFQQAAENIVRFLQGRPVRRVP